ncbi:hypothetical protein KUTeg_020264 [Tegillarca granosa]|uniref:Novel STAND NTPase 3 domain-containing protein n=1 Tax=Tegillarca granosa TaxID=220873 RepID=A0ABQ9EBL6_TEGGR|nr:hypothetical protein KUTeg_020264 [Tegillarca granosa]
MNLLSRVSKEGYYPIILSDPALIEQAYDPDKQVVYFVDDAFGTPTLNYNLVQIWIRLHGKLNSVISNGNCNLVLASRKQAYSKAYPLIIDCPRYIDNVIDLTNEQYQLSSFEKKKIIACHVSAPKCPQPRRRKSYNSMAPVLYVPGFPLLCSLYAKHDTGNISTFFEKPISFLQRQISSLRTSDPEAYCALVVVMLYNGRLKADIFNPFEIDEKDKEKIKRIIKACGVDKNKFFTEVEASLQSLVGIYLENDGDCFVFTHDSVFDAMCLDFGMKYPKQVLEVASSDFITSRVRTEDEIKTLENPSDVSETVCINASHYNTLAQRWLTDIKNGKISNVFDNPCSNNIKIVKYFVDYMSKLEEDKRESEFESLFGVKDIMSSASLLEMMCKRGISTLVKPIFNHGYQRFIKLDDKFLSFIEGVRNGHESIVKAIAEYEPDIKYGCLKNGRQAIHVACENGNPKMVKILIDMGVDVSKKDILKVQPIHLASKNKDSDCLLLLLENGASCDAEDHLKLQPTHYACESGSVKCLKALTMNGADINRKDSYGKSSLHYAATCENTDVLDYLLNIKPNINVLDANGNSVLHLAIASENSDVIKRLIDVGCNPNITDHYGRSPLHIACSSSWKKSENCDKCVETLTRNGADVNMCDKKHRTPLYIACSWACDLRYSCMKILLQSGADVKIADFNGKPPVTCAFESKSIKCAKLLFENGEDLSTANLHPVHSACSHGNYEMLLALHEKGFPLSSEDTNGKNPIHLASQYGRLKCLIFLLQNGVDINIQDRRGMTPLHYAYKWGRLSYSV